MARSWIGTAAARLNEMPWESFVAVTIKCHLLLLFMLLICPGFMLIAIGMAGASEGHPKFMIFVTMSYYPVLLLCVMCDYQAVRKLKHLGGRVAMATLLSLDMTLYVFVTAFLVRLIHMLF